MLNQFFGNIISWYMGSLNYWTITLLMAIESSFIPLPSELVIPPAAYQASLGMLNIWLVVLFSTIGCVIGALFNYVLSITLGRKIIHALADTRIAKMMFITPEKIEKSEQYFIKHGKSSTFIGRLVPGVRHLISIPAGLSKMNISVFILYTFIGSAIWNAILGFLSYYLCITFKDNWQEMLMLYFHKIKWGLLVLGVIFIIYLIIRYKRKKD